MLRFVSLALFGCSATTGVCLGPTIDGDAKLGFAADAHGGPVEAETITATTPGGTARVANLWMLGVGIVLETMQPRPHFGFSIFEYVEYLRMGTLEAPWGYHARLAVGLASEADGSIPFTLVAGPNRISTQRVVDTNDGPIPHASYHGLDLSLRYMLHARCWLQHCKDAPSPWQLGLFYEHQSSTYAPEVNQL